MITCIMMRSTLLVCPWLLLFCNDTQVVLTPLTSPLSWPPKRPECSCLQENIKIDTDDL